MSSLNIHLALLSCFQYSQGPATCLDAVLSWLCLPSYCANLINLAVWPVRRDTEIWGVRHLADKWVKGNNFIFSWLPIALQVLENFSELQSVSAQF
jgi:hypothetical protein